MKKNLLKFSMLVAVSTLFFGCSPEEEELVQPNFVKEASKDLTLNGNCETVTFDKFITDSRGFVTGVMSNMSNTVIGVQAFQRRNPYGDNYSSSNYANIFDSGQPTPNDDSESQIDDLLTPNKYFLTPKSLYGGVSTDNPNGYNLTNDTPLGKMLIVNRSDNPMVAYDYNEGGKIVFDFSNYRTVTMSSISVIDIDHYEAASKIVLYNLAGEVLKEVAIPVTGDNGKAIVDLGGTSGVAKMEVYLGPGAYHSERSSGSGAVDNIVFNCMPKVGGCNYTQGYWKNHATGKKKDVTWGDLAGATFYGSDKSYLQILQEAPKGGNGYIILAHQFIAAQLNMKKTYAPTQVLTAYANAMNYFTKMSDEKYVNTPSTPYATASKAELTKWADVLAEYNEGRSAGGPGHCD